MRTAVWFEVFNICSPGGAIAMIEDAPMVAVEWVRHMKRGADCAMCGKRLKRDAGWRRAPAVVAAVEVPGADGEPRMVVATMCGKCAATHDTPKAAGDALCMETAGFLGVTEAELVQPMPAHDSVQ